MSCSPDLASLGGTSLAAPVSETTADRVMARHGSMFLRSFPSAEPCRIGRT